MAGVRGAVTPESSSGGNGRYSETEPANASTNKTKTTTTRKSPNNSKVACNIAINMAKPSTSIIPAPACPCKPDASFFCEILGRRMTTHLAELCRTQPAYREKWERQRDDPAPRPRFDPPPPLRQWLVEQLGRLRVSEARQRHYRAPDDALCILDGCCSACDQYDQRRESCRAIHGCGSVNRYRHSLTTVSGRCPLGFW
jgi:hypothetical protein